MPVLKNVSKSTSFSALLLAQPVEFNESSLSDLYHNPNRIEVLPGQQIDQKKDSGLTGRRYMVYLWDSSSTTAPVWSGYLLPDDEVDVTIENDLTPVIWSEIALTMEHLDYFLSKADPAKIPANKDELLTQLKEHARTRDPHGHLALQGNGRVARVPQQRTDWSECQKSIGLLTLDAFCFALSIQGARKHLDVQVRDTIVDNLLTVLAQTGSLPPLEISWNTYMEASRADQAHPVFRLARTIGKVLLEAKGNVFDVAWDVYNGLSGLDFILYGIIAGMEIFAHATGGGVTALVAKTVVLVIDAKFIIGDLNEAIETCSTVPEEEWIYDNITLNTLNRGPNPIGNYNNVSSFSAAAAFTVQLRNYKLLKIQTGLFWDKTRPQPNNPRIQLSLCDDLNGVPGDIVHTFAPVDLTEGNLLLTMPEDTNSITLLKDDRYWLTAQLTDKNSTAFWYVASGSGTNRSQKGQPTAGWEKLNNDTSEDHYEYQLQVYGKTIIE